MHKKATYNLAVELTLKELHAERHVDRAALAEALDASEIDVSKMEHGEIRMTAGELLLMLDYFNLSWDDFSARLKRNLQAAAAQMI